MAKAGRIQIESVKLDSFIPQSDTCMRCHVEILDHSKAHYGRITVKWTTKQNHEDMFHMAHGRVVKTPVCIETSFPETVRGLCCDDCFNELWAITWRDKNGHLRHAFDSLKGEVIQPKNDDFEASPITKGLYAPHVSKGGVTKSPSGLAAAVISDTAERAMKDKLDGFNRPKRDDIKIDHDKTKRIVRNGKWKVDPATYKLGDNRDTNK